jgi:hypothetical protein
MASTSLQALPSDNKKGQPPTGGRPYVVNLQCLRDDHLERTVSKAMLGTLVTLTNMGRTGNRLNFFW